VARKLSFRLRVHLATAFLLVLGAVAAVTALHAYQASSRLLLSASDETFGHVARETGAHFSALLAPTRLQLELLARHGIATAPDLQARLRELPVLLAALEGNRSLSAIRIGYDSGDYFAVRRLADGFVAESVENPRAGPARAQRLLLDARGGILRREPAPGRAYDPRSESWYYRATDAEGVLRSDLYGEPGSAEPTTAFSRRAMSGASVVRLDMALGELSARLAEQRVSDSTQIALLDMEGGVVAPVVGVGVARARGPGRARLVTVFELDRGFGQQELRKARACRSSRRRISPRSTRRSGTSGPTRTATSSSLAARCRTTSGCSSSARKRTAAT
jgi:hypothetical protein